MDLVRSRLQRIERKYAVTSNPRLSITYMFLIKCRIFCEWLYKRAQTFGIRRKALRTAKMQKSSYKGHESLVVGNGPSAKKIDWDLVVQKQTEGLIVIAINYFPITEFAQKCKPQFLVLSDPVMKPDLLANERNKKLWEEITSNPSIVLVVPTSWYRLIVSTPSICNQVHYFDDSGLEGFTKNISPLKARGYIAMTAYKALAYSIHLGFEKTFIVGIDNTMFQTIGVTSDNRLVQRPNHLSEKAAVVTDVTDFYFSGIADYFYDISSCFQSLHNCFKLEKVVNLDLESLVDCFPKSNEFTLI